MPHLMTTLSSVLNKLQGKGIDKDFRWTEGGFTLDGNKCYQPNELMIIKIFRFEELKDPGDSCVLYLIKGDDNAIGYILDAYGVYSNHDEEGFINAIRMMPRKNHQEQLLFEL
jgi:hypothetical protein